MNKLLARLGVVCSAGLLALGAAAAPVVTFTPSTQHAEIGQIVDVEVSISGLGDEVLSAFDLNFLWDSGLMGGIYRSIDATPAQDALGGSQVVWSIDTIAPGNWGIQASSLLDDAALAAVQPDAFLLAQFSWSADADGVTTFGLGLDPDFERNFVGLNFTTLDVSIGSACVAIGTGSCGSVPEPATAWLVALALAGVAAPVTRRRRR